MNEKHQPTEKPSLQEREQILKERLQQMVQGSTKQPSAQALAIAAKLLAKRDALKHSQQNKPNQPPAQKD